MATYLDQLAASKHFYADQCAQLRQENERLRAELLRFTNYCCSDCSAPVAVCPECSIVVTGCACGNCEAGFHFIEEDFQ